VCGQLHALAPSFLGKELPVSTEQKAVTVTAEGSSRKGAGEG